MIEIGKYIESAVEWLTEQPTDRSIVRLIGRPTV